MAKTRNITPDNFFTIDRLWAENGVIKVRCKDGYSTTLTVEQAAKRASALNQMNIPDWYKKSRNNLVEKIIKVCREAKSQQESPDKKTEALHNVMNGKTTDGKEAKESVEAQIQRFMFMFPTLTEKETEAVATNKDLDIPRKEQLLKEIHRQRLTEMSEDEAVAAVAPKLKTKKES